MILDTFELSERDKRGRIQRWHTIQCDVCNSIWKEDRKNTLKKAKSRDDHLCTRCLAPILRKQLVDNGTRALRSISVEDRKLNASKAGVASHNSGKPAKSWFSTERWESLSKDKQREIVTRANAASVAKVKSMTDDEKACHYLKVMKGALGFISVGQRELTEALAPYGFAGEVQISDMRVDVCHVGVKLVIEYNGDAYHCNPKYWGKDQYSTLIRMKAGEKWQKDIARYQMLKSMGYTVIVVWESEWKTAKSEVLDKVIHSLTDLSNGNIIMD